MNVIALGLARVNRLLPIVVAPRLVLPVDAVSPVEPPSHFSLSVNAVSQLAELSVIVPRVLAAVLVTSPVLESPVIVSREIDPPNAVEVPAIVIEELDKVALGIALRVRTPALESVAVTPDPLRVCGT
jgi:hypothetical protein